MTGGKALKARKSKDEKMEDESGMVVRDRQI